MLNLDKTIMLNNYYKNHNEQISTKILKATFVFLFLSIVWNSLFLLFSLPFSRANILLLCSCLIAWFIAVLIKRLVGLSSNTYMHLVMLFMILVVCILYFGSGYREAWGFFFLIPLVSSFYGDKTVLLIYSLLGMFVMIFLGLLYPIISDSFDAIDLSNRVLLYIIIATFGHLILTQLNRMYDMQVNMIIESAETTISQVVKTFIISVEAKDSYTFGHSERVAKYAAELALSLPEYQDKNKLKTLYMSGLLHDIGKINISEDILTKEGPLSTEEYDLIKLHPIIGARMVERLPLLGSLKPGVLYHHEKWNGGGYPTGIRGTQIPLDARVLAIADTFDAITSNRSYRTDMPPEQAFEIIESESGTHFDPYLIEKLIEIKTKWIKIHNEASDEIEELEKLSEFL